VRRVPDGSAYDRAMRRPERVATYALWALAAVGVFLLLAVLVVRVLPDLLANTDGLNAAEERGRTRTALLAMLAGVIAVVSAIFTGLTWQLNRRGQHTERFTRATDQLGRIEPEAVDVRLGGIYALEQIASESPRCTARSSKCSPRMSGSTPTQSRPIDLRKTNLTGVRAAHINLEFATLHDTQLYRAFLLQARLEHASLHGARLQHAELGMANLRDVSLADARLDEANLMFADLEGANLWNATLHGTKLLGARLGGAKLEKADLTGARYDAKTVWPDGFDPAAAGAVLEDE
jgi:hypothetical protein